MICFNYCLKEVNSNKMKYVIVNDFLGEIGENIIYKDKTYIIIDYVYPCMIAENF